MLWANDRLPKREAISIANTREGTRVPPFGGRFGPRNTGLVGAVLPRSRGACFCLFWGSLTEICLNVLGQCISYTHTHIHTQMYKHWLTTNGNMHDRLARAWSTLQQEQLFAVHLCFSFSLSFLVKAHGAHLQHGQ